MVAELEKTAFQQTEVGEIPSDWEVDQIGKLIRLISGQHILNQDYNQDGKGVPYLTGPADFGSIFPQISKWTNKPKATALKEDILITVKGDGVGKINLLNVEKVAISRQLMAIHSQTVNGLYLYQYLKGKYSYFQELSTGSTVPGLSRDDINRCVIPLPPTLTEQTAIATALTDADALITQLEKLIAKKKAIKQGAMQELLKPKEGWEEKKFGEVIALQGGSQPPLTTFISSEKEGFIRLLQIRDYKTDNYKTYIPLPLARKFCKKDDIMIGRYGPPVFQILTGLEGAYNVALMKAIPSSHVLKSYAYHFLKQQSLFSFVEKSSQRTAGQSGIDIKELNDYPFAVPPKEEQTRIAQILSDMDAEIEKLEQRLAKQKMLKQGMMQLLLTGRIRLLTT